MRILLSSSVVSEEGLAPCPACDPDPGSHLCIPKSSSHLIVESSLGLLGACLAATGWTPAPVAPSSTKLSIGFVYFVLFLLLLIFFVLLVLLVKLF